MSNAEYRTPNIEMNVELKAIRFAFIELTKFKKKEQELKSLIDKWTFFIKNAPKLEVIPDSVDDEGLREAYLDADRHKWKKAELIAYDNASIAEQDEKGKITPAKKKGTPPASTQLNSSNLFNVCQGKVTNNQHNVLPKPNGSSR